MGPNCKAMPLTLRTTAHSYYAACHSGEVEGRRNPFVRFPRARKGGEEEGRWTIAKSRHSFGWSVGRREGDPGGDDLCHPLQKAEPFFLDPCCLPFLARGGGRKRKEKGESFSFFLFSVPEAFQKIIKRGLSPLPFRTAAGGREEHHRARGERTSRTETPPYFSWSPSSSRTRVLIAAKIGEGKGEGP